MRTDNAVTEDHEACFKGCVEAPPCGSTFEYRMVYLTVFWGRADDGFAQGVPDGEIGVCAGNNCAFSGVKVEYLGGVCGGQLNKSFGG